MCPVPNVLQRPGGWRIAWSASLTSLADPARNEPGKSKKSKSERSHPRRVADHGCALGYVAGHDRSGPDDRVFTDRHAGEDDGAASDPDVLANADRLAVFQPLATQDRIARMVRREDLHRRADLAPVADLDADHIEEHAAKVHKDPASEADVITVVAVTAGAQPRLR